MISQLLPNFAPVAADQRELTMARGLRSAMTAEGNCMASVIKDELVEGPIGCNPTVNTQPTQHCLSTPNLKNIYNPYRKSRNHEHRLQVSRLARPGSQFSQGQHEMAAI